MNRVQTAFELGFGMDGKIGVVWLYAPCSTPLDSRLRGNDGRCPDDGVISRLLRRRRPC